MKKTLIIQSTNPSSFSPPVNIDSDSKDIFVKFNFNSSKFTETDGKYSFLIFFENGFPGGDIKIENLSNGEILEFKGYNNSSGVFKYKLDDIKISFTYYINNEPKTISKNFYFKNALNFTNQMFRTNFLYNQLKPTIYNNYLKIAYNKNVSDFDAHIYFNDDQKHDLNLGCYSYQDFNFNSYKPSIQDFTIFKLKYNDAKLGLLTQSKCKTKLWDVDTKSTIIDNPKSLFDLFFFYKKLRKDFKDKGIDPYPFRLHYINPILQINSLIIDYYD